MAANILTVLNQMIESPQMTVHLKHGLGFALFGDNLDFDDWRALNDACDISQDKIIEVCKELLPKYRRISEVLNNPRNAEDWQQAMYGDNGDNNRQALRLLGLW